MKTILCLLLSLMAPLCVAQNLTVTTKTGESEKNLTLVYAKHEQDGKIGFVVQNEAGEMGFMAYDKVTEETLIAVIEHLNTAFNQYAEAYDMAVAKREAAPSGGYAEVSPEYRARSDNYWAEQAAEKQRKEIEARMQAQQAQIERLEKIEQRRRNEPLMGNQGTVIYTD